MTSYEPENRKFEQNIHRKQLSTTFHFTIEELFETLDTADVDV